MTEKVVKFKIAIPYCGWGHTTYVEYSITQKDLCTFLNPNETFRIRIGQDRIVTYITSEQVTETIEYDRDKIMISDVGTVLISKKWIQDCIELYLRETELLKINETILKDVPTEKSCCDLFNEQFELAEKEFMEGKSDKAIDTFINCANSFPTNKKYKDCMYKVAICYAEKSIESHNNNINEIERGIYNTKHCYYDECSKKWVIKPLDYVPVSESNEVGRWLNKAFDEGYDDWCSIIDQRYLKHFKNEKEIIEVIKKMKKKNSYQSTWCTEIASYVSVHGI